MKKIALLLVFCSGCVSASSFNSLKTRVLYLEKTQRLNNQVLFSTVKVVKSLNLDIQTVNEEILDLAKAANFLFGKLKENQYQTMINQAGLEQSEKELENLEKGIGKIKKSVSYLAKRIKDLEKSGAASENDISKLELGLADLKIRFKFLVTFLKIHLEKASK